MTKAKNDYGVRARVDVSEVGVSMWVSEWEC